MGRLSDWERLLDGLERIALDTSAVIYFLDRTEPYAPLVGALFRRCEAGDFELVLPALVETELLVGPLRDRDDTALERIALLLDHFPNLRVVPLDRAVARAAARIRARHGLATPDALIAGTAEVLGCDAVVGNDRRWASRVDAPRYVVLADFA